MSAIVPRVATGLNESHDPRVLRTLGLPGVAVAVWHRAVSEEARAWLDGLPADRLPRMRHTLPSAGVAAAATAACDRAGTPEGPHRVRLVAEIAEMAAAAAEVLASPLVEVRLDVTAGQSCPRWYLDAVPGRLLCALRGRGTEFGSARPDGAPAAIHALPTGAAGIFRGLLWPGREFSGVVHRSPPPVPGETRLLLVVDPVDDAGRC